MVCIGYWRCYQGRGVPAGRGVLVRRDDEHPDGDGGAQQVDHLLVRERGHGHLADLHQAASLPQAGLPGVPVRLHLGHDALVVDVETQLAQAVAPQRQLSRLAALGQELAGRGERERSLKPLAERERERGREREGWGSSAEEHCG